MSRNARHSHQEPSGNQNLVILRSCRGPRGDDLGTTRREHGQPFEDLGHKKRQQGLETVAACAKYQQAQGWIGRELQPDVYGDQDSKPVDRGETQQVAVLGAGPPESDDGCELVFWSERLGQPTWDAFIKQHAHACG